MRAFVRHMFVCFILYRLGYFFTKNTNDRETWGFYRLNFMRPDELGVDYAILDIDFGREREHHHFSQVHGGRNNEVLHRYDML